MTRDDQDNQTKQIQLPVTSLSWLQYTIDQYIESPTVVKQTNEWVHDVYQHLAEKDKQLQLAELELNYLKGEYQKIKDTRKALDEKTLELVEKEVQLRLLKQEMNYLKEGSRRASFIQHGLSLITALSLGSGINFVTSSLNIVGWPLILVGVATQSISFYLTYTETRKSH